MVNTASTTTTEWWAWNGVPLNQPYWNISTFGGSRQDLPLMRGQNYPLAYRSGQGFRPKQPDQRVVSLAMWAAGIDSSSLVPAADQRLAFNNNFQQLRSMFWTQGNLGSALGFLTRRWYLTQNGVTGVVAATAQAEIAGTVQPTMSGRTRADFTVDLLLADPYFYGNATSTRVNANGSQNLTNLGDGAIGFGQPAGSGGVPFTIQLTGPLTSPITLTNATAGVTVTLAATIPAGQFVTLDVLNYTAYTSTNVSLIGEVSHAGARPWMLLMPAIAFAGAAPFVNVLALTTGSGGDTGYALLSYQYPFL